MSERRPHVVRVDPWLDARAYHAVAVRAANAKYGPSVLDDHYAFRLKARLARFLEFVDRRAAEKE